MSWADNIPLESLNQLQQATGPSHSSHGDVDGPASIPLPISKESLLPDPGSADSRRTQEYQHATLDTPDQLHQGDTAEALDVPLPDPSGPGNDRCSSVEASIVDPLDKLQTTDIPGAVEQLTSSSTRQDHRASQQSNHSALDAAPKQPQITGPPEALDAPRPESIGLGNDRGSSGGVPPVDSLAQLQTASIPALADQSAEQPIEHPPEHPTEHPTERPTSSSAGRTYWENIKPLTKILPHLNAIQPPNGRHERMGRLKAIDYFTDGTASQVHRWKLAPLSNPQKIASLLQDLKRVDDDAAVSRMIIVEDLSPVLIELLGSVFELDPEFFAEHLNRSGYNSADYGDPPPTRWNTAHMRKNYASMTWRRPVYQSTEVAELLQTPGAILEKRKEASRGSTSPAKDVAVWRDAEFDISGERNLQAMEHDPLIDTNIFRQSWPLSTGSVPRAAVPDTENEAQPDDTLQKKTNQKEDLPMAALEERVTYCCYEGDARIPIGIILVDPLPAMTDVQTPLHARTARRGTMQLSRRFTDMRPPSASNKKLEVALPMAPRLAVNISRNKYKANDAELKKLEKTFVNLSATFDCLRPNDSPAPRSTVGALDAFPVITLLKIIENDTRALFRSLEWTLDDISHESQDDFLVARRLPEWRKLMNNFEIEIPAIARRLKHFADFVFRPNEEQDYPGEVSRIIEAVDLDIAKAKSRLADAYAGLRADMQFTESRRSITEAQTVTRLTELAFVFIPLSFCASLFSMSIHELENGVPVWIFVVTALATIALAYAVRLFVGSELLVNSTRRSVERFWGTSAGGKRGFDAPVFTIAWFTAQEIWYDVGLPVVVPIVKYSGLAAMIALPVAFMWTSESMGNSFNTVVTLLIVLSIASSMMVMPAALRMMPALRSAAHEDDDDSSEDV